MAAVWQKNEVTASKRRCDLRPASASLGTVAPRATDFTGYVFITRDGNDYVPGTGTVVNKRRALVVADFTFTAAVTDICTKIAHTMETGDGPVRLTTTTTLPAGLSLATDYWFIKIDADTFYLATSLANAYAGTRVDITTTGTGTHTVDITASTQRGVDGDFTYTATQAETNYDTAEISVAVLGHATYEAYTTVNMDQAASIWSTVLEGSSTAGDLMRGVARSLMGKFSKTGNDLVFRDLADSKNSHTGTVTASGRTVAAIVDLT